MSVIDRSATSCSVQPPASPTALTSSKIRMSELAHAYRGILRELRKSAVAPRKTNKAVASNFRSIATQYKKFGDPAILQDLQNGLLFLRSQREHKLLIERYNPLFDLTAEERIKATARRVGLDMPVVHKPESG